MTSQSVQPKHSAVVLLFGPQALSFDRETFRALRSAVDSIDHGSWVKNVFAELPQLYVAFTTHFPQYYVQQQLLSLEELVSCFEEPNIDLQNIDNLANSILTPLVVIWQLLQYSHVSDFTSETNRQTWHTIETLGLCTGILSAIAVSSGHDQNSFQSYAAVSIRLAMLVGVIVDQQDKAGTSGTSKSFATHWTSPEAGHRLKDIVEGSAEVRLFLGLLSPSFNRLECSRK